METGLIVLIVLAAIVGVAAGYAIGKRQAERRYASDTQYTQGTLNVDCSESEFEPGLYLGLGIPVGDVISRKYIVIDVNVMLQNSRK